jgi:FkbM family methyltransferase
VIRQIKNIFKYFGLDVIRYPSPLLTAQKLILEKNDFNIVLDIGANEGFYARELWNLGYRQKIISFEPILPAYRELLKYISKKNTVNHLAVNCALGEYDGQAEINISENSVSSSLLEATSMLDEVAPAAHYVKKQITPIYKLDTLFKKYCDPGKDIVFMKMDAQGYERNILKGAQNSLPFIKGIQLEVSIVELYQGELLLDEMLPLVKSHGYDLHLLIPGFIEPASGRLLQVDCIFLKTNG